MARNSQERAAWISADAVSPFFLFVNYMDTHRPYMAPGRWPDRYPGRREVLIDPIPALQAGRRDLTEDEQRHFEALYDGAIAYVALLALHGMLEHIACYALTSS